MNLRIEARRERGVRREFLFYTLRAPRPLRETPCTNMNKDQ